MLTGIDLNSVRFADPLYLWLLILPAVLLIVWGWQLSRRRRDTRRFRQHRRLPVRERFPIFGGLAFWLCVIFATAFTTLALARPTAAVSPCRTPGFDLAVLQAASAPSRR